MIKDTQKDTRIQQSGLRMIVQQMCGYLHVVNHILIKQITIYSSIINIIEITKKSKQEIDHRIYAKDINIIFQIIPK